MPVGVTIELGLGSLLVYGIPFIIVVGWFSSRLLGVHRGWGRSLVAGFFGWVGGVAVAAVIENHDVRTTGQLEDILPLALFFGVLISMFVGLILDVILKPKHGKHHRLRWLIHPIATIKRRLAPFGRFREILRFARKRGLQHYASASKVVTPEFARRLRLTLEDCGGMFVKFGQIASTRSDLLPEVITTELAQLQSAARPVPADEVREMLEQELGASVEEEFASFDFEPLAAASIGQTHRAVLKTGEHVVVKVQRPGIEDIVHRDAAVLRMAAGFVERRVEAARILGVKRLAEELILSLEKELDYGAEAASGIAFLEHLEDDEGIAAPKVYQSLSTRRVLVMEEIRGVTVADHAAIEAAPDAAKVLASRLLQSFLDQVLRDGLYHADPHPGNIFVDPAGLLWFLDFGAVGRLSPVVLEAMQEMAIGFQLNDPVVLARAHQPPRGRRRRGRQPCARGRHRPGAHRRPRRRQLRSAGDEPDARRDAAPRARGSGRDDGALARAAHARGDAPHHRSVVQHRARSHRTPARVGRSEVGHAPAAAGEGSGSGAAVTAHPAVELRSHRHPVAAGAAHHAGGAVRRRRP